MTKAEKMAKKSEIKIDIVIPWVDGSDPKWLAEKNKYLPEGEQVDIDASAKRWRDWDNVQYIFRGIEKFCPWVNKVFFITCGQVPSWLNTDNEKLVLVNHKDYIPQEYLPTFASRPIELNLHRLEGLSEHFIYVNDDFFFTRKCNEEDFFKDGLPKLVAMEKPKTISQEDIFDCTINNNVRLIASKYDKHVVKKSNKKCWYPLCDPIVFFVNKFYDKTAPTGWAGIYMDHLPAPFLKSAFEECWQVFPKQMDETSHCRFRSRYSLNQYIVTEYMLCKGTFAREKYGKRGANFSLNDVNSNIDKVCQEIKKQKHKTICLNDVNVQNFEETKQKINNALEYILPEKSSFEK